MVISDDKHVLFIEPEHCASKEPVLDAITEKMKQAMARARPSDVLYRGWHFCKCGARSEHNDYILHTGQITNSLAVHYLEYHRDEVPEGEIEKVLKL